MSPLFTCKLPEKSNDKAIPTMIYAVSHIHSRSLKNLRHTVCIPMQPNQAVQRESNNESKSTKSIPTSNFIIYKKSYLV